MPSTIMTLFGNANVVLIVKWLGAVVERREARGFNRLYFNG
ncbi:MAG: hypothetical protein JWQ96_666 [Segetibacter sp.]|nr:hypothetical protein [Segetibacter sp.]